ncbi:MAG TPA: ester cyclase [Gammaproteobacteria bacterium]|nr:ester cyclase [Gammaproteobacteria bacterium]
MSAEENKAVVRRYIEEAFNQGNLDVLDEVIATDGVHYANVREEPVRGPEQRRQAVSHWREAFPDLHMTLDDLIAEGEKVSYRWTARGTHQGEFLGIASSGKQMTTRGIVIERLANGKFTEGWTSSDTLGLMRQLGGIPERGDSEEHLLLLADQVRHRTLPITGLFTQVRGTGILGSSPLRRCVRMPLTSCQAA